MKVPDLQGIFHRPFPEQLAAFRLRLGNLVPTSRWDDLRHSAHDRAFMVAGATKADLLADLAQAVDKAIEKGTSLEEFRRDFRQIVEDHGWHGWTGEGTKGGEAWRTRVIYRTNAKTSYAAGRWAQLMEGGFKYGVYRHGASREPREWHLAWDGLILPIDHPFWQTHAPPNGWGCSCYVNGARSMKGAIRLGGDPSKRLPPDWDKIDPRTGAPAGIDKGWAYAPGASVSGTVLSLRDKLEKLPERPSIDLIQSWLTESLFGAWLDNPVGLWPLARIPQSLADEMGTKVTIAKLSPQTAAKQLRQHPELSILDYGHAQEVVSDATEIIRDGANNLIFVKVPPDANGHVLVVKATLSGNELYVTSFRRLSADVEERDRALLRLRRKER
ncbi:phage minor head protein [Thalassovita gelatinovora]|uniref:phage minor head protein n=1 Tax=Thalassovita gelatinovora TaxID=53501 RepID=UPI001F2215EF|nr:phage minor head protein [Thalassovita gelatinovora]